MTPKPLALLLTVTIAALPALALGQTSKTSTHRLEPRHGSRASGTVSLRPQGNKTLVTVYKFNPGTLKTPQFTLHTGSDCITTANAQPIPLNPVGTGQTSQTVVQLPIEQVTKNYVVDVRDATARRQFSQACARLNR